MAPSYSPSAPPTRTGRSAGPGFLPALLCATVMAGCGGDGINEINLYNNLPPGVTFRVIATPTEIAPGEEMSIALLVENGNDHTVTLNFSSDCTGLFIVEDPEGGRVYPREGQECPLGSSPGPAPPWNMFPGQQIDLHFTWTGVRAEPGGAVPLETGPYHLFGVLGRELAVRTPAREVTIR